MRTSKPRAGTVSPAVFRWTCWSRARKTERSGTRVAHEEPDATNVVETALAEPSATVASGLAGNGTSRASCASARADTRSRPSAPTARTTARLRRRVISASACRATTAPDGLGGARRGQAGLGARYNGARRVLARISRTNPTGRSA